MKRIAVVGAGQRAMKYFDALGRDHAGDVEVAAVCDASLAMLELKLPELQAMGIRPRVFSAPAFDAMIREVKPETVVVLTPDFTHEEYVCRAMELGCDVIVEKPLATSYESCRNILAAQVKTGRRCAVTLNYRYIPSSFHIKHLLQSGAIGDIVQVTWADGVNLGHGVKFFRRWHSERARSGSLLVHKCCHKFDLVNFWLGATPRRVSATGALHLFGPGAARRMGLQGHGARCGECAIASDCPYYIDVTAKRTHNESPETVIARGRETGYYRDLCVFRDAIDTHDTLSVMAEYETGAQLCYSWSAAQLGSGLLFRGTRGALEYGWSVPGKVLIRTYGGEQETVDVWKGEGGHNGADPLMFRDLFGAEPGEDRYGCRADLRDGVWSVLLGLGALESIESGEPVDLADRVSVDRPDFKPMPSPDDPLDPDVYKNAW